MEVVGMKKLIFVCGASGIGKSTICKALYPKIQQTAFVDSDHCRMINPFEFSDELKMVIENNMTTLLINYLKCSVISNIIFLYGFHGPRKQIFDNIMSNISQTGILYKFIPIILECEIEENIRRARKDGRNEQRIKYGIEASRAIYNQYDYRRLDITHLNVDEAAECLMNLIVE